MEASARGSKGGIKSRNMTRLRSNLGRVLALLGLSLWKLAINLVISGLLLISKTELPGVSAMAFLYPSMVEGRLSLTLKRKLRKLQISSIEGFLKSTCVSLHQLWKPNHMDA